MATDSLADPTTIGEAVEERVIETVPGLEAATDRDDWFDAVVRSTIGPRTASDVTWLGICLLEAGARVEIKAARRAVSKGTRGDRPGRWLFTRDQHETLLQERASYLLVLYADSADARNLLELVVAPASIIDECVRQRWYDVDRREGQVAQLPWPVLLGDGGGSGAE